MSAEFGVEPQHARVVARRVGPRLRVVDRDPAQLVRLGRITLQRHPLMAVQQPPQRHVSVAVVAARAGNGEEKRVRRTTAQARVERGRDRQLLPGLPQHRIARVLERWIGMPAGRKRGHNVVCGSFTSPHAEERRLVNVKHHYRHNLISVNIEYI